MGHTSLPRARICAAGQLAFTAALVLCMIGCARSKYRKAADAEAYRLVSSRQTDPRWVVPERAVEPSRLSRMYLANEMDCGPQPADDSAAHRYMSRPDRKKIHYYDKIATRTNFDNPAWLQVLPRDSGGRIKLTQPLAMDLGLINSREYQTEIESVYGFALALSSNRFEFATQWFWGFDTDYLAKGEDLGGQRNLKLSDQLGFKRNLAGGGEFTTDVLNSLSWSFTNGGSQLGTAQIVSTFTQPLLRGAFRHVRLENLTQAERNLLYEVRDFARFRRLFYVNVTEQYLRLLTRLQAIRNTETNVANLKQNLDEHNVYSDLKIISQVSVDQVFQQYQNGRRTLLTSNQELITAEDDFKFLLGLPAWLSFELDESLLQPFELVDPKLVELQDEAQDLFEELVQFLPPSRAPLETLNEFYKKYDQLRQRVVEMLPGIEADLDSWLSRLDQSDDSQMSEDDRLDLDQQKQLAERVAIVLTELRKSLAQRESDNQELTQKLEEYERNPPDEQQQRTQKSLEEILESVESFEDITLEDILPDEQDDTAVVAWKALEQAVGRQLREEISDLYVAQTQIRLFLIEIEPLVIPSETAITFAHHNRLDLMNSQAEVVDAFRAVEVAADALQSDLGVTGGVTIGSDSSSNSPFKLDSANNEYNLKVEFDGPLNRLNERNVYRASQIAYQQTSRAYIAAKDDVANEVRQVLRQLELSRVSFQINRQQVVAATRQVELAQIDLRRSSQADSNLTLNLLLALEGLLDAKNRLIRDWVNYRIQKMGLFAALDMLYLAEDGTWINEQTGLQELQEYKAVDPQYFPPGWTDEGSPTTEEIERYEQFEPIPMGLEPVDLPAPVVLEETDFR